MARQVALSDVVPSQAVEDLACHPSPSSAAQTTGLEVPPESSPRTARRQVAVGSSYACSNSSGRHVLLRVAGREFDLVPLSLRVRAGDPRIAVGASFSRVQIPPPSAATLRRGASVDRLRATGAPCCVESSTSSPSPAPSSLQTACPPPSSSTSASCGSPDSRRPAARRTVVTNAMRPRDTTTARKRSEPH
jgi:hypothetical protein